MVNGGDSSFGQCSPFVQLQPRPRHRHHVIPPDIRRFTGGKGLLPVVTDMLINDPLVAKPIPAMSRRSHASLEQREMRHGTILTVRLRALPGAGRHCSSRLL